MNIEKLPSTPGVYQMFDAEGNILYIGKAKNLKKRVSNYVGTNLSNRIARMVFLVRRLEYIATVNEAEALLLEARLIKKHQPKYNILLKDDKSFPYIRIRRDHPFPQITKYRGAQIKGEQLFGPFASVADVNKALKNLQQLFKLRPCGDSYFASRKRPCLQYQINRCSAPCVAKISEEDYAVAVAQASAFLRGQSQELQAMLSKQMAGYSEVMDYEKAAEIRDKIKALSYIQLNSQTALKNISNADVIAITDTSGDHAVCAAFYRGGSYYGYKLYFPTSAAGAATEEVLSGFLGLFYQNKPAPEEILLNHLIPDIEILQTALHQLHNTHSKIIVPKQGAKKDLVEAALDIAKEGLVSHLKHEQQNIAKLQAVAEVFGIPEPIQRIEVYDNSHIMGSHGVGGMIVATNEGFAKDEYRRYSLNNLGGDDYAMLREVLRRRLKRLKDEPERRPNLMIIDGGKGHLSVTREVMAEFNCDIFYVCMAKGKDRNAGRETFHLPDNRELTLSRDEPVMKYLQILRDEVHGFAIRSHRQKRSKALITSSLDQIPDIGPVRKKALLHYFGSFEAIKLASKEDLAKVKNISSAMAEKIFNWLHSGGAD